MTRFPPVEVFHASGARLGEGPCWHPGRQTLWWVDILGQRLFEADLAGNLERAFSFEQMITAVAPTRAGGLVATLRDGVYLIDPARGIPVRFAAPAAHDARDFRFNDAKVDPQGRLWAGTLALDGRREQSRLYRIDGDRRVSVMREKVSLSNGLAWAPDGRTFYYIDTPTRTVQAFAFDADAGTLGPPRIAITFAETDGWPDGCCMDAEGKLWVAHWGAAKVTRWDPVAARLLATVSLPVRNVTSCAFGGPGLDQLFITTAFDTENPAPEPEAGHVFRLEPGTVGAATGIFSAG